MFLLCSLIGLVLREPAFAEGAAPSPRAEELAEQILAKNGSPALPGLAWSLLSKEEKSSVQKQISSEEEALRKMERLQADLDALIGPEPLGTSSTQNYRFSPQVRDEMIARILVLMKTTADQKPDVASALRKIADLQPNYDPRVEASFYRRNDENKATLYNRLNRLSQLFAFGISQAAQKKIAGDFAGAKESSAAAFRALIEAYLTVGVSSGRQRDFFHRAALIEMVVAFSGYLSALGLGAVSHTFNNPVTWSLGALGIGSFVAFVRDLWMRDSLWSYYYDFDDETGRRELSKPVDQPVFLPAFLRTRLLRARANGSLAQFWMSVNLNLSFLRIDPEVPRGVFDLLKMDDVLLRDTVFDQRIDIATSEAWAQQVLAVVSDAGLAEITTRACENALVVNKK
jgi:hypothetical protein